MKIVCITHADFETPGVIRTWAQGKNHVFKEVKPYAGESCISVGEYDWLVVMGGPQSPTQMGEHSYLKNEIRLIQTALDQKKTILGFCLGAQLIGEALGARTEKSPSREIGVFPIHLTDEAIEDPLLQGFPRVFPVIHWHNDMPGLTEQSTVLAASEGCPRQIVRYRSNVYGFQCHLEITHEGMKAMVQACPNDLAPGTYVQSAAVLLKQNYSDINGMMVEILDRLFRLTHPM